MSCNPPPFTTLSGADLSRTLGQGLIETVDSLRDLHAQFGLRPYRVRIIVTEWTGGERGLGEEVVVRSTELLPVPKVSDVSALAKELSSIGLEEAGSLMVSEISGRFGEGVLTGHDAAGNPPEQQQSFQWEVLFLTPGEAGDFGVRRRFFPSSAPTYDAAGFQWRVTLARAHPERLPNGEVR